MTASLAASLIAFSLWATASSADEILRPLSPQPREWPLCGCSFSVIPADPPCVYDAPDILHLHLNGKPPRAIANIGKTNFRLEAAKPLDLSLYDCTVGKVWMSDWLSKTIGLHIEVRAEHSGPKACWFEGTVHTTFGAQSESLPIEGSCEC
jgi:hypothetical protein